MSNNLIVDRLRAWALAAGAFAFGMVLCAPAVLGQISAQGKTSTLDPERELPLKITAPFTLASVGDLIIMRPAAQFADPAFQSAIKLIKDADVAFGNFEASLADLKHFSGPLQGFIGTKAVAADLKALGFDILNRANNHLFDSELEGMWSTNELLDEAGLVHAGTGRNLDEARAAAFLETPKGRVGLVGIHSPTENGPSRLAATQRLGNAGGRPGLNALQLTVSYVVPPEHLEALRKIRDAAYEAGKHVSNPIELPVKDPADRLQMFGTWYTSKGTPGTKSYAMNPEDLRGILRGIRNGKQYADFMIANIHAHQGPWAAQRWAYEDETPDFLIELARKSVDNGADAFIGHGPHVIRGIEIYKGKPIFYGLGEFFREMDLIVPYVGIGIFDKPDPDVTELEQITKAWERFDTRAPIMYESLLALSRYDGGKLVEVRLHPIDARFDGPISRVGIPRIAPPEIGARILKRVQALSKPFGTTIAIEGNVGVIRVPANATSAPQ